MTGKDGESEVETYDYSKSTEGNHRSDDMKFYGEYTDIRAQLDYTYHSNYTKERQRFQDSIIRKYCGSIITDKDGYVGTHPEHPWIVFTAGAMGAGKGHTMEKLRQNRRFPLVSFVIADPDEIRREFPEYLEYVKRDALTAGELTMKEAGFVAEILQLVALDNGKNVLVDGSLRDHAWYSLDFHQKREKYPKLKLAIIHVVAPREAVFARAESRAKVTGRVVPKQLIELSLKQCAESVGILRNQVDFFARILNAPNTTDVELLIPESMSWDEFADQWKQSLKRKPGAILRRFSSLQVNAQQKVRYSEFNRGSLCTFSSNLERGILPQDVGSDSGFDTSDEEIMTEGMAKL